MTKIFKTKKALRIFGICVPCVALLSVVLRLISLLFFFDADIGYFKSDSIFAGISGIIPAAATLACAILCLISQIKLEPIYAPEVRSVRISAAFPALAFAAFSGMYIYSLVNYSEIYGSVPFSYILCVICAVGGCAFFILKLLGGKRVPSILTVFCGLCALVWVLLALVECYFNTFIQMNSPIKLTFQYACLSAMLFLVSEMRRTVDTDRASFHLFSSAFALIYLPVSAIPSLICFFAGKMPYSYSMFYYDAVFALLTVFAAVRFITICFCKQEPAVEAESTQETEAEVPVEEAVEEATEKAIEEATEEIQEENTENEQTEE